LLNYQDLGVEKSALPLFFKNAACNNNNSVQFPPEKMHLYAQLWVKEVPGLFMMIRTWSFEIGN